MQQNSESRANWHLEQLIDDVQRRVAGGTDEGFRPHVRTLPRDYSETGARSGIDGILRALTEGAAPR